MWEANTTTLYRVSVRGGDMRIKSTVIVSGVDNAKDAIDLAQAYFGYSPARKVIEVELLADTYVRKI